MHVARSVARSTSTARTACRSSAGCALRSRSRAIRRARTPRATASTIATSLSDPAPSLEEARSVCLPALLVGPDRLFLPRVFGRRGRGLVPAQLQLAQLPKTLSVSPQSARCNYTLVFFLCMRVCGRPIGAICAAIAQVALWTPVTRTDVAWNFGQCTEVGGSTHFRAKRMPLQNCSHTVNHGVLAITPTRCCACVGVLSWVFFQQTIADPGLVERTCE